MIPLRVQVELTTRCNLRCAFCGRETAIKSGQRQLGDVDWATVETIAARLAEYGDNYVWVSLGGMGEPTLHPRVVDAIRIIRSSIPESSLKMVTNITTLNEEFGDAIIHSGLGVLTLSLNTADRESFEQLKGLDYVKIENNIIKFLRQKGDRKPDTFLRINAFDCNLQYIGDAQRFWRKYLNKNDRVRLGNFSNWTGLVERSKFVNHKITAERTACKFLTNLHSISINFDGSVFPCCVATVENQDSALYLGNIADSSIADLYTSDRMSSIVAAHETGNYPTPCDTCDDWGVQVENLSEFREQMIQPRKFALLYKTLSSLRHQSK